MRGLYKGPSKIKSTRLAGLFRRKGWGVSKNSLRKTAVPKIEIIFRRHRIVTNIAGNCIGVTPTKKLHEEKNSGVTKEV